MPVEVYSMYLIRFIFRFRLGQRRLSFTYYFSQGVAWGFNTEHTNNHIQSTKIIHSQQ